MLYDAYQIRAYPGAIVESDREKLHPFFVHLLYSCVHKTAEMTPLNRDRLSGPLIVQMNKIMGKWKARELAPPPVDEAEKALQFKELETDLRFGRRIYDAMYELRNLIPETEAWLDSFEGRPTPEAILDRLLPPGWFLKAPKTDGPTEALDALCAIWDERALKKSKATAEKGTGPTPSEATPGTSTE